MAFSRPRSYGPLSASLALALAAGVAAPATLGASAAPALAATAAPKVPVARVTSLDGFPSSRRIVLNTLTSRGALRPHNSAKVRVTNTGKAALRLTASAAVIMGARVEYGPSKMVPRAAFRVSGVPHTALKPGAHADLTVTYVATAAAPRIVNGQRQGTAYTPDRGTLTITTNDAKHRIVRIALVGAREYQGGFDEPTRDDLTWAFGWRTQELAPRTQYRFRPVKNGAARIREVAAFGHVSSTLDLRYRTTGTTTRRVLTRGVTASSSVRPTTATGALSAGSVPGSTVFSLFARVRVSGEKHTRDAATLAPGGATYWRVRVFRDAKGKVVPHQYLLMLDEPVPGGPGNGDFQDEVLLLTGVVLVK